MGVEWVPFGGGGERSSWFRFSTCTDNQHIASLSKRETVSRNGSCLQRPPLIFLWPPRSGWGRVLASRLLGVCLYSLRIWRINVLRLDFDESCKLLKSRCLERFMFCSLASRGRCCGEFLNNGRAEFCEMWNSRLDRASFGILRAAARFCLGLFSFPSGFCLILYGYDLFMS